MAPPSTLGMEVPDFSETLVTVYQVTWCHISNDSNFLKGR
jgi:hypothetical protein